MQKRLYLDHIHLGFSYHMLARVEFDPSTVVAVSIS